jgi:hypothetical protein
MRSHREAVAAARNGGDGLRTEQLAQRADVHLQVVFLDHHAGPDDVDQLALRDEPARPLGKGQQDVEGPCPDHGRLAVDEQDTLGRPQLDAPELQRGRARRWRGIHGRSGRQLGRAQPSAWAGPATGSFRTLKNASGRFQDFTAAFAESCFTDGYLSSPPHRSPP